MRNWASSSSIHEIVLRAYKGLVTRSSEFVTRLVGVRNESWGIVVFEGGKAKEVRFL